MNFVTTGFSYVFPLITFPYVTRVLGSDAYGDYEFANSCASFFLLFAQLGVGSYGVRECAKVRDDRAALAKVSKELLAITSIAAAATCAAYLVAAFAVPSFSSRLLLVLVCGLNIPFTVLGVTWYFQGTEQFSYVAVRTLAVRVAVLVGMFVFVRDAGDVLAWALVSVAANSGAYLVNYFKMRRELDFSSVGGLELRQHMKPLLVFFLAMASITLYSSFSSMLLGVFCESSQVGYFSAAVKIKGMLIAIMTSLTSVLTARASYYVGKGDMAAYKRAVAKSVHFALVVIGFLAALGALFAEPVILLLAGAEYLGAVPAMRLMMLASIAISFSGITANEVLTPLGQERYLTGSYVAAGLVGLALNMALIPSLGATGAAIATATSEFTVFLVQLAIILAKRLMAPSDLFSGLGRCLPPLAVAICVSLALRAFVGDSFVCAVAAGVLGGVCLLILLVALREPIGLEIWQMVRSMAGKILGRRAIN